MTQYKKFGILGIVCTTGMVPYLLFKIAATTPQPLSSEINTYIITSVITMSLLTAFLIGFVKLGKQTNNVSLTYATHALIIFTIIHTAITIKNMLLVDNTSILPISAFYGVLMVWFGISLLKIEGNAKSIAMWAGILYITTGLATASIFFTFITLALAIPSQIALTLLMFKSDTSIKKSS